MKEPAGISPSHAGLYSGNMTAKLSAAARTRIVEPRMLALAHPQAMLFMNVLQATSIRKTPRGLASPQIPGSRRLQPLRAAHLPPLQNNMSSAGGALLGLSQWEGEKEGISVGGARRMNAAAQTVGQFADDR